MDRYTFEQNGLFGIVLDSNLIAAPQGYPAATAAQLSWLKTTLASSAAQAATQVVVFQHIPYFFNQPSEADSYYNLPSSVRGTYLNLLISSGVEWVFSGHLHNTAGGLDGNLDQIVSGAVGMPLGSAGSGLTLVSVTGTELKPIWYCLASIPNSFDPTNPPVTTCSQALGHNPE
jgi:3',5'-cyclic AMP phosphodiesterase CpdA